MENENNELNPLKVTRTLLGIIFISIFVVTYYYYSKETEYTQGLVYKKALGHIYFYYIINGKKYSSSERIKSENTYKLYKIGKVYTVIYSKYNYRISSIWSRVSIERYRDRTNTDIPVYPEDTIIKGLNDK
ncbi:MAG: hypothetical protein EAZ06_12050 [Cytophagales bacterium]|nr:MAG: hypothetical protein EAZ06_12050 [Cytophagales bacterium]